MRVYLRQHPETDEKLLCNGNALSGNRDRTIAAGYLREPGPVVNLASYLGFAPNARSHEAFFHQNDVCAPPSAVSLNEEISLVDAIPACF